MMIGHQLTAEQLNLIDLQTFVQNSLKRGEVRFFPKNVCTKVTAIEGMIKVRLLRPLGEVSACDVAP